MKKFIHSRRKSSENRIENEFSFTEEHGPNHDRDPFLHSLKELDEADIPLLHPPRVRTRGEKIGDGVRKGMLILSCAVFIGSIVYLIDNFAQKARAELLYDEAAAEFEAAELDFGLFSDEMETDASVGGILSSANGGADAGMVSLTDSIRNAQQSDGITVTVGEYDEQMEKLRSLLRNYQNDNEDVFGYISIPSVDINYVTVQGEDNDYYLNHTYKKEYLVVGSIYMDYRCDTDLMQNYNTVLYGHNIERPGIMFHHVIDFFEPELFQNELIYMYTVDGVYVYKPFSIYETRADSGYIRTYFATEDEFVSFCTEMQSRSELASDVVFDGDEHLLTLSTCTNRNNGRYALHAYLVEYIT